MHSRILHRLSAVESGLDTAAGSCCLSYTSDRENSLDNLIIHGNASAYTGPFGKENSETGYRDINVRIHGRNIMGGEEFYSAMTQRFGSYINHSRNGDLFEFSYTYVPSALNAIGTLPRIFKENTVYTFRFHFKGKRNSSTGIQIFYSGSSCEDILAGDTDECDIAYSSAPGKTIAFLSLSNVEASGFTIDLSSFGIFEGEVGYDDFEPYSGNVYTISTSSGLCGQDDDVACYDSLDWKNKISTLRINRVKIDKSGVSEVDYTKFPAIVKIGIPTPVNAKRPSVVFHTYEKKGSYDEILGESYTYTVADESSIYISLPDITEFNIPKVLLYAKETNTYVKEDMCIDIPPVPRGYVGIEVWAHNLTSKKLIAHYKK